MKKTVYSILILALIALMYSCKLSPEQLAIGTWKLDSVSIINIDEVTNFYYEMDMNAVDGEISTLDAQLQTLDPKDKKNAEQIENISEQKKSLEEQKAAITLETAKAKVLESYTMLDGFSYTFNEDKTYLDKTVDYEETGTWSITEDGKTITMVTEAGDYKLLIQELTENTMSIKYEYAPAEEGDVTVDGIFYFIK